MAGVGKLNMMVAAILAIGEDGPMEKEGRHVCQDDICLSRRACRQQFAAAAPLMAFLCEAVGVQY
jgi:hypothetical protein